MKTFKFLMPFMLAVLALASCNTDDLRNDIDELKNRVESLEAQVASINENMNALRVLIDGNKTISSYTYDETTGTYKLTLSDGSEITLTQGKTGSVNYPSIGIDENGNWTVNGESLGQPAVGQNGATPEFRIEEGTNYWQVKFGAGEWQYVVNSNGDKVQATTETINNGDQFFKSVEVKDGYLVVVLNDENSQTLKMPIVDGLTCEIITEGVSGFDGNVLFVAAGATVKLNVNISGDNSIVTAPNGWIATLSEPVDGKAELSLTAPVSASASTFTRATADNTKDVVVQANKGINWAVDKIQVEIGDGEQGDDGDADEVTSYYEKYNNGETFEIAGVQINNQLYPDAIYVEGNVDLTSDNTIYFVKPGQDIKLNYVSTSSNLGNTIIIGDNSSQKSSFVINGQYIKLKEVDAENKSLFLCYNVEITANQANYSMINYGHMKKVIFDKCVFKLNPTQPFYSNGSSKPEQIDRYIDEFVISNSVLDFAGCTKSFFVADGLAYPQFGIILKNNIFYSSGEDYITRLFSLKLSTASFTMENNTFYKVTSATNAYFFSAKLSSVIAKNNIFYSEKFTANNLILKASTSDSKFDFTGVACQVENNVGVKGEFASGSETKTSIWQVFYGGSKPDGCTEITNLKVGESPFDVVDVQSLTFKPKAEYSGYGATIK
ncbi:DUF4988 domain-containing protein [Bacteroides sp. ET336]|uniref:DUF4988 domain-containing protein n=1 Tax=Bacteroides sp. ET336 TaxID=2972459 RepID=UPI0021ACFB02|nr:DUF4988 domain-containing protein [Bacteroides sp. ET336]MCR8894282.1 DUF4988 domain-containing protein [Bacteroides sp. ET336]MDN0058778.1 DUF4988 domain-containing protein [Bacteroides caecigallinarum]